MSDRPGTLYLVPNTLDLGEAGLPDDLAELLPRRAIRVAARLEHWLCENARTTRAFLKRVDAVIPLARPLQQLSIVELPRPAKGRPDATAPPPLQLLAPALAGADLGLISDAGLPAVADPGAAVVAAAHAASIPVVALPGASAIVLAVAASGLDGQSFAFVGYVPVAPEPRAARIRELEAISRRHRQTQLMIETPYRNAALFEALLAHLQPATRVCVSAGLTLDRGFTRTNSVVGWRSDRAGLALPNDLPAIFALLATG